VISSLVDFLLAMSAKLKNSLAAKTAGLFFGINGYIYG
jgi:hypothetical protein